jgi:hypothetical protein
LSWAAANARARGLGSRLVPAAEVVALSAAPTAARVVQAVGRRGFPLPAGAAGATAVESALRSGAAAEVALLARWLDRRRRAALAVVFAPEDARSVRRIVRGLLAGAPPATRLAGTFATPTLPARALGELARLGELAAVGALLTAWGSPFGGAVAAATTGARPDLLRLELALADVAAGCTRRAAKRGDFAVRRLAARTIDAANCQAALLLAAEPVEERGALGTLYREGGRALARERFLAAAGSDTPAQAARLLAPAFRGDEAGALLASGEAGAGRLERALLAAELAEQRDLARRHPESAAPTLAWLLAQRTQTESLRAAAWSVELSGGPG